MTFFVISKKTGILISIAIGLILSNLFVQNLLLAARVKILEERQAIMELIIERYNLQNKTIQECIKKENPDLPAGLVTEISKTIISSANGNNLSPLLLASLAREESSFVPTAVSSANARGLCQVQPATFREVHSGDIDNWQDNIEAGARYLRQLIRRFGDLRLALAAYNCGPSRNRERILEISGEYADLVISGWNRLKNSGGDNVDGMRPLYLASSRW